MMAKKGQSGQVLIWQLLLPYHPPCGPGLNDCVPSIQDHSLKLLSEFPELEKKS